MYENEENVFCRALEEKKNNNKNGSSRYNQKCYQTMLCCDVYELHYFALQNQ